MKKNYGGFSRDGGGEVREEGPVNKRRRKQEERKGKRGGKANQKKKEK